MTSFPVTWVLVADRGRSRLFSLESPHGELIELTDAINPDLRLHEADLTSDRPGMEFDPGGQGRHAMRAEHSHKEHSSEAFAQALGQELLHGLDDGRFERLVLVSPPEFLGILRQKLDQRVCQCVAEVVGLDLTKASADEIAKRLPPLSSLA